MLSPQGTKPLLLIFPFNILAHYLRCLKLAKQLQPYFEIQFLHSSLYASYVDTAGYKSFTCDTFDSTTVQACIRKFDFSWLNENDLDYIYNQQVAVINALKPIAVLGDTMPTLKMAAEKTNVKFISLINGYLSRYQASVHRMPSSHPLYKYLKVLPHGVLDLLIKKGEKLSFRKIHKPFRKLRSRYGLPPKESYEDELEGDINLLCDLPEMFPQKKLPAGYYLIPPLFHEGGMSSPAFIANIDKSKKSLFISMGSTGDWRKVGFLNNPYFEQFNLITAGDTQCVVNTSNVIKCSFVNIHELFPLIDLVICHGGNGTIYQSLLYGIPILSKTAHLEQEWNVDTLEKMHLGKSLDDIQRFEDIAVLIEEWIARKKTANFIFIQNKIKESLAQFPSIIKEVMNKEFPDCIMQVEKGSGDEAKQVA